MALDLDTLAVDPVKAKEGVWVNYMGARFRIARLTHPDADRARKEVQAKFYQKLQEAYEQGKDTPLTEEDSKVYQDELNHILAEHILTDWEGVERGGKELPYSVETAFEILSDPKFYEFHQFVIEKSLVMDGFRPSEEAIASDVKTSAEA